LGVLEYEVLRVRRSGDINGFEIPARYFRFVRTGDASALVEVLHHNRLDLLSLAGLTARILHLVQTGPAEAATAREALAVGRVYRESGFEERAEEAFTHALALCQPQTGECSSPAAPRAERLGIVVDALRSLALGARRQRRYERAATWWRQLL